MDLATHADHVTQAVWGCDCAQRVLRYFEMARPNDLRPRLALATARTWIRTGIFKMSVIRAAALGAHAAARAVPPGTPARSAARAAGQAVAAAHSGRHAIAAAIYAATAVYDAFPEARAQRSLLRERTWQYKHLAKLLCKNGRFSKKLSVNSRRVIPGKGTARQSMRSAPL